MTIYKYTLRETDYAQGIDIPKDARFLACHTQKEIICIWFMVEPNNPRVFRYFRLLTTGQDVMNNNLTYLGTVHNNPFVWHIFEEQ